MRKHVHRWLRDERGSSFEGIALCVSIIAVGFVASADVLNYMSKKHGAAIGAAVQAAADSLGSSNGRPGLDYTPTGTIAGLRHNRIVLDPCIGEKK